MKYFLKQVMLEVRLHFREPEVILWGFVFPSLMLIVLGIIFSRKEDHYVVGLTPSAVEEERIDRFRSALEEADAFDIVDGSGPELEEKLKEGGLDLLLELSVADEQTTVRARYTVLNEPRMKIATLALKDAVRLLDHEAAGDERVALWQAEFDEMVVLSERGEHIRYAAWLVPGVMMYSLFMGCIFGIGIVVVRDKTQGKFKRLATTPLSKLQFILIKSGARLVIMLFQAAMLLLMGYVVFGATVQGSMIGVISVVVFSMLTFLVFGFGLAAISKSIEKAVALANIFFMLTSVLSGVFFSNAQFSPWLKGLAYILPVTSSAEMVRGMYTYGQPLSAFLTEAMILGAWLLVALGLSVWRFKWYDE